MLFGELLKQGAGKRAKTLGKFWKSPWIFFFLGGEWQSGILCCKDISLHYSWLFTATCWVD